MNLKKIIISGLSLITLSSAALAPAIVSTATTTASASSMKRVCIGYDYSVNITNHHRSNYRNYQYGYIPTSSVYAYTNRNAITDSWCGIHTQSMHASVHFNNGY